MRYPTTNLLLFSVTLAIAAATSKDFVSGILGIYSKESANKNLVLSPVAIESGLSLLYMGAESATATELAMGLRVKRLHKTIVPQRYEDLFSNTKFQRSQVQLKIANRIYVDRKYTITRDFNQLAERYFGAKPEALDFSQSPLSAWKINTWVETQTAWKIKNIVNANEFNAFTASVLVNGIYFQAKWWHQFYTDFTVKMPFSVSKYRQITVNMMKQQNRFRYGDLNILNAKGVEMKYLDTDITMLIILPNQIDGLPFVEHMVKLTDLRRIADDMRVVEVKLALPKFKIECDLSLQPTLEQMGMRKMFTKKADFSDLIGSKEALPLSEFKHKAIIEINESGTDATTAFKIRRENNSALINVVEFTVNRPFMFVIKDREHVYFVGHIIEP